MILFPVLLVLSQTVSASLYRFQDVGKIKEQTRVERWKREGNYVVEINNLRGKSGQGYHIPVEIGTPKQKVNIHFPFYSHTK